MSVIAATAPPPGRVMLERGIADIWCRHIGENCKVDQELLSDDEQARADRFHFQQDRHRFVVARCFLRETLGKYLDADPASLRFTAGPNGKPSLAKNNELRFNLSHSGEIVVVAVTAEAEIGVDVEKIRSGVSFDAIAGRYFHPNEARALLSLPNDEKAREFFVIWTRIEARLKALGLGLTRGTRLDEQTDWATFSFVPAAGYVGAVALENAGATLRYFSWPN